MALEKKQLKNSTITEHCCCITFKVVPKTICIHAKKTCLFKNESCHVRLDTAYDLY